MKSISETWTLEELEGLNDEIVRAKVLDQGWEKDKVVTPKDVGLGAKWLGSFSVDWTLPAAVLFGTTLGSLATAWALRRR